MANFNRVIQIGHLTDDPKLSYTQSGKPVCNFVLAVNRKYGKGADVKDEVTFMDVTTWDKLAEICSEFLVKGSNVLVEGELRMDVWEKDGVKRSKLKVVASRIEFLNRIKNKAEASTESVPEQAEQD